METGMVAVLLSCTLHTSSMLSVLHLQQLDVDKMVATLHSFNTTPELKQLSGYFLQGVALAAAGPRYHGGDPSMFSTPLLS